MAAALHAYKAAAWRTITKWQHYLLATASWVEVKRAAVYRDNGDGTASWHNFYVKAGYVPSALPPPDIVAPPPPVNLDVIGKPSGISGTRHGVGLIVTTAATFTVSNGYPPYTYAFSNGAYTGVNAPIIVVESAGKAHMTKVATMRPERDIGELKCLVTDKWGNVGFASVPAAFIAY